MQALWQDAGQRDRESRFERFSSSAHLPSTDVKKKKWKRRRSMAEVRGKALRS